ncbi:LOW QUALITY PROTEIN: bromodomain-containing protein 4 [Rhopalosiphum maidis]|uniref:LOW QUALITY PROTEIN: bromodomain-containing protein 4 n=1 Tax=Rhopalosiphum maidis TaxID=43146 RepID=UPI000EFFEBAA|nr:LOW QUALITY PROTEIN: bromodomain-containing protein 4 [Rhopalosiphum maidis]
MDLTYLVVAVFGMCVLRPCSSLPAAAAAAAPTPTPSPPSLQVAAAEPAGRNDKRSRSLFQSPPQAPHQYHLHAGGAVDLYDDVMNDLPYYLQHQQHQHQQQFLQEPTGEDDLRTIDGDDDDNAVGQDMTRLSSRARPAKPDSPMYFIRLPPQPYMYVPGYGYVSQPTRLKPPPFTQRPHSPFLNLPLSYVSNAKPVGIYTLPQQHHGQQHQQQQQQLSVRPPKPNRRPQPSTTPPPPPPTPPPQQQHQPDSPIYNLDKGPYVFNGRPTDVFLLQSAYDNLYSEVLQNIYP